MLHCGTPCQGSSKMPLCSCCVTRLWWYVNVTILVTFLRNYLTCPKVFSFHWLKRVAWNMLIWIAANPLKPFSAFVSNNNTTSSSSGFSSLFFSAIAPYIFLHVIHDSASAMPSLNSLLWGLDRVARRVEFGSECFRLRTRIPSVRDKTFC